MRRAVHLGLFLCFTLGAVPLVAVAADGGEVSVGLSTWRSMVEEIARLEAPTPRSRPYAITRRSLEARYAAGLLSGTLQVEVETQPGPRAPLVPLIDAEASLSKVLLDGERAVAVRSGRHYAVLIERPGRHTVQVELALGREQARFARAFKVALPPAPVTRLELALPENGLDVEIDGGVVLSQRATEQGTQVLAAIDGRDTLAVRWQRRAAQRATERPAMALSALTLVSLTEDIVKTDAELVFRVLSGETDRVEVGLPAAMELTRVSGEAVLQWYGERAPSGGKRLVVLLKHLVSDEVAVKVEAQAPRSGTAEEKLLFLDPLGAEFREGWVAIEGRDGFEVSVVGTAGADEVGTRELPSRLAALTDKPLLAAYRSTRPDPEIRLTLRKNAQIELTQAVIDDLQVSSVLVEQGLEITKMRLYVRNNTRQYLSLALPAGAVVTHAMLDGNPVYPGVSSSGGVERLLLPLRQSEKLSENRPRHHVVHAGETLGEIAMRYFNRTDRWNDLVAANPGVRGPEDLRVGQRLIIPASAGGVRLEESNFVLELAYKLQVAPLSFAGSHAVALPELDIPVMSVTWHYYFPEAFEPVRFESSLKQLTAIRYDPLRRLLHFLDGVGRVNWAWASSGGWSEGESAYQNILESRKAIYQQEQQKQVSEAFSAFPLVGELYRFKRVLLGEARAELRLVYVKRSLLPWVQWGALLVVLLLGLRAARTLIRRPGRAALASEPVVSFAAATLLCLLLGHYVLGTYRHALLGLDLALLVLVAPRLWERVRQGSLVEWLHGLLFERLWRLRGMAKLGLAAMLLALLLAYPLLLSTFLFLALAVAAYSGRREVRHA